MKLCNECKDKPLRSVLCDNCSIIEWQYVIELMSNEPNNLVKTLKDLNIKFF